MAEETIFEGDKPDEKVAEVATKPVTDTQASQPVIPTELQGLVGEGKKYATVEAAFASIAPAQDHIARLEEENRQFKQSLEGTKTVKELIDELRSTPKSEETPSKVEVNQESISAIVAQELAKADKNKTKVQNQSAVAQRFVRQYGTKGEEVYNRLAKDSGLSVADLNVLASTSPNAVFRMAGLNSSQKDVPSAGAGTINTQALHGEPSETTTSKVKSFNTKDVKSAWAIAGEIARKKHGLD